MKLAVFGLGPIGQEILRTLDSKGMTESVVAAIDIHPELIGRNLNELLNCPNYRLEVQSQLAGTTCDIAIFTTTSHFPGLIEQVTPLIEQGISVVTTCEEAAYPWRRYPEAAKSFDAFLKQNKACLIGTGINPGFLMDGLPVFLSSIANKVNSVEIKRKQNALNRRLPFQQKIGSGLTLEQFQQKIDQSQIGHVGLEESAWVVSDCLGLNMEIVEENIRPVLVESEQTLGEWALTAGQARGLHQEIIGKNQTGQQVLKMLFRATLGEEKDIDQIKIHGEPNLLFESPGGINGDRGTVAMAINSLKAALDGRGLLTTRELIKQRLVL
jgi:4-hydroxy-tetrahydrodipicolinate reductase